MKNIQTEYARAIFELATESGEGALVRDELHLVKDVLGKNPAYGTLLDTPAITTEEKFTLLESAFQSLESQNVKNLLKLLTEQRRMHLFLSIVDAFDKLMDEMLGILRVEAITAVAMNDTQKAALTKKLERKTGKHIVLTNTIDKGVLGGMLLRYGEVQLDGTLKTRLDTLADSIQSVVIE